MKQRPLGLFLHGGCSSFFSTWSWRKGKRQVHQYCTLNMLPTWKMETVKGKTLCVWKCECDHVPACLGTWDACAFFMGSAASARPVKKHVHRRIHCHQFLQWYVSLSHTGGSLIPGAAKETWSVNIVEMIRQTQMYAREISRNTYTSMRHYIRAGIVPRFGVIM